MIARAAAVILLLAAAIRPEIRRYRAERLLWRMHAAADLLADDPARPENRGAVEWIARSAGEAAAALPGDPRPWMLEAEARLGARDFAGALEALRRASAAGERADVDFETGRALVLSRDFRRGQEALVRAAWISPAVLSPLPDAAREALERELARLGGDLRQGRLTSPPPRPD